MTLNPAQPELNVISDFLRECAPFDMLTDELLQFTTHQIQIIYFAKGEGLEVSTADDGLRIIRSGAVELHSGDQQLLDVLGEGESFNLAGLNAEKSAVTARFTEDTLIYFLPRDDYKHLRKNHRGFDRFFHSQRSRRLRRAARYQPDPNSMMQELGSVIKRDVFSVSSSTTLQETARLMTAYRISSMLVIDNNVLQGIVTDRDLRSRAIAEGRALDTLVKDIMTDNPLAITADKTLFDATLLMTQKGYHHLPVMESEQVVGVITASDLMLARRDDPVYLVQHISRAENIASMQSVVSSLPNLMQQWVSAGARAEQVSRIFTAISDAITRRLIELAVEKLGEAPVAFCWLGFGSQARGEQLLGADQDNGLLIDDRVTEQQLPWFKQLATYVCDGLNECGYDYCHGKVMAITDEWRQPLAGWKKTVASWTSAPTPDAVMRVSIFFDLRAIYGEESLCQRLQAYMLERTQGHSIFLAALAENVLSNSPPLGLFRRFVVERNGEHKDSFDLKKRGVLPIIDMVRIHALANGISVVNTRERITELIQSGVMTTGDGRNLQDAFDVIMQLRIKNQAEQIASVEPISNFCNPAQLNGLTRKQLRDAFTVVDESQSFIRLTYRGSLG